MQSIWWKKSGGEEGFTSMLEYVLVQERYVDKADSMKMFIKRPFSTCISFYWRMYFNKLGLLKWTEKSP